MKIKELLNKLNIEISDNVNIDIHAITNDSRKCDEHTLYINTNKNINYLDHAVKSGVRIIVSEDYIKDKNIIAIYVKDVNSFYYQALKIFYPFHNAYIIGVTGTCGKTTTVSLLYESLKYSNNNVLLICSNGNFSYYNNKEVYYETFNTTPNIETVYKLINEKEYDFVIIECSSQGIMNNRLEGIVFDLCVFLNLSNEHLDFHKNINSYLNAKLLLFKKLKANGITLVNFHSEYKSAFLSEGNNYYTFGINEGNYFIEFKEVELEKMKIKIKDKWVSTSLTGAFNAENISCVNAILNLINVSSDNLIKCLENNFIVPGRLNVINYKNSKIIIDFAHTEKEVEVLLKHLKNNTRGKLYLVIGCGGNRDKSKRSIIGKLCELYGDYNIFTEDNSRDELTIDIIGEMLSNYKKDNYIIIINRKDAIKFGISLLDDNDILATIGMGVDDLKLIDEVINNETK